MATTHSLLMLPGDGIGPEVMAEVERFIAFFNKKSNAVRFETKSDLVGGAAYDKHGVAITDDAMVKAKACDAILFGAVGGPKWDKVAYEHRPEAGLLRVARPHVGVERVDRGARRDAPRGRERVRQGERLCSGDSTRVEKS